MFLGIWMGVERQTDACDGGSPQGRSPSAEFVESFVIFLYGSTNVFLEHLAAWGGAWTAQDLEHVSISIMFFGGGLCGMLIESKKIRQLLNTTIASTNNGRYDHDERWTPPKSYPFSLNPFPALIILLLGTMMSSHHQASQLSAMVHKQWGTLFVGFALAKSHVHLDVPLAADELLAFTTTGGAYHELLSNLGWDRLYG